MKNSKPYSTPFSGKTPKKTLGILGCGWLGSAVALHFIAQGWQVRGTVRKESKKKALKALGVVPTFFELGNKLSPAFTNSLSVLLISIPPGLRVHPYQYYLSGLENLVFQLKKELPLKCKVFFISSTGVYPNTGGPFSENSMWHPNTEKSEVLLTAETLIKEIPHNTAIIRFAGLVGAQRQPLRFLSGKKELPNGNKAANLIDQRDAVRLIWYLNTLVSLPKIVNGVFPMQVKKAEYYTQKAIALGIPAPEFKDAQKPIDRIIVCESVLDFNYLNKV